MLSNIKKNLQPLFSIHRDKFIHDLKHAQLFHLRGRVLESTSLVIRASVPAISVGELCHITADAQEKKLLPAQVVGFKEDDVFLMPLGETTGLSPNSQVIPSADTFKIKVGYKLLGRVLNGLGQPIDHGPRLDDIPDLEPWPIFRPAPDPYSRTPIDTPLSLGIRAIDSLLSIGKGQRVGLFAGSGVGKSSLMGQMVRNTEAQIVVVCLVGERGREVMEFIKESLGPEGQKKCVMVVATSDTPSLVRYLSCFVATAIAEWFRDQQHDVLFLMDSATRFARAQREIGLALGEPPARQGYPPSVFAQIPKLLERTGTNQHGSITAIYTVLVQGGDFDEPIADEVRGILDGHIILSRELADRGHWPAIDILPSLSRVMNKVIDNEHKHGATKLRALLSAYEKHRDLIILNAYQKGTDPEVDLAIEKHKSIQKFLRQSLNQFQNFHETKEQLLQLVN